MISRSTAWRIRFSAVQTKGTLKNDLVLPLMYNDQIHMNAARQVTYADRTPGSPMS